jgi:protein TonB
MPFPFADSIPKRVDVGELVRWDSVAPDPGVIAHPTSRQRGSSTSADEPLREALVDKPALPLPNNPTPGYPEMLRAAGVTGAVVARFVIDSAGRAEVRTLQVVRSDHELFTAAVRTVLPRMRFIPAEVNGRRVRVLVEQAFVFRLTTR